MSSTKFRFDGWVLDPESGDLERGDTRVRLQGRPTRALQELLAHAGSVVTREQLIARLWPKGVVDFDTSLNTVICKLRSALGDVAETPHYIETLPRRGYRFIGGLEHRAARAEAAPPSAAEKAPGHVRVPISVLPFSTLNGDVEQRAISDGITEASSPSSPAGGCSMSARAWCRSSIEGRRSTSHPYHGATHRCDYRPSGLG